MKENTKSLFKERLFLTTVVALAIWTLLAWNYYHGGVPSHHVLARKDLPLISNWWGAILLPILTWLLTYLAAKRIERAVDPSALAKAAVAFFVAIGYGALIATFFTLGPKEFPAYLLQGILILAVFLPLFRAEYLLGFVLGMTYTFGAVLPLGIGSVLVLICFVLYHGVRLAIKGFRSLLGRGRATKM
jgi:hypothetical protein